MVLQEREKQIPLTCAPTLGWTRWLQKLMPFVAEWPERWTHFYSWRAELTSRSRGVLRGFLFLHLRVLFLKGEKKRKRNKGLVKPLSQKDSDCIFHFLSVICHGPPLQIFSMKKPKCHLCQLPTCHPDKVTTGQPLIFWWISWQDAEPFVSAASRLSCCK